MYVNVIDYVEISDRLWIELAHFFKLKAKKISEKKKQKLKKLKNDQKKKTWSKKKRFFTTLVASNFAKNRENVQGELCLNVIIPFSIIVCSIVVA